MLALFVAAAVAVPLGASAATPAAQRVTSSASGNAVRVIVDYDYVDIPFVIDTPKPGISNARVDVAITGSTDLPASKVGLQYRAGSWTTADLHGTADQARGISGYLGPKGGSRLAPGKTTFYTRIRFEPGTAPDLLDLDYTINSVDPSDTTKVSTLAHQHVPVQIVRKSTPDAPDVHEIATSGNPRDILLNPTNADGYGPVVTHTNPRHGKLTQRPVAQGGGLVYTAAADFAGTDTFTYTAHGAPSVEHSEPGPTDTGTVTIAVKAPSALHTILSPGRSMVGQHPRLVVQVTSVGTVDGGTVTVGGLAHPLRSQLSHGSVRFTLPALAAGRHKLPVTFAGTSTAYPVTGSFTDTVVRYASRLTASTHPSHLTNRTAHPRLTATVRSTGGSTSGGTVTVLRGSHRLGHAVVRSGRAAVVLPKQPAGRHSYRVVYSGTRTTAPATLVLRRTVARR